MQTELISKITIWEEGLGFNDLNRHDNLSSLNDLNSLNDLSNLIYRYLKIPHFYLSELIYIVHLAFADPVYMKKKPFDLQGHGKTEKGSNMYSAS